MEDIIIYEILKIATITSLADREIIFKWLPVHFGVFTSALRCALVCEHDHDDVIDADTTHHGVSYLIGRKAEVMQTIHSTCSLIYAGERELAEQATIKRYITQKKIKQNNSNKKKQRVMTKNMQK